MNAEQALFVTSAATCKVMNPYVPKKLKNLSLKRALYFSLAYMLWQILKHVVVKWGLDFSLLKSLIAFIESNIENFSYCFVGYIESREGNFWLLTFDYTTSPMKVSLQNINGSIEASAGRLYL